MTDQNFSPAGFGSEPSQLAPLTVARVANRLDAMGAQYRVDEDGDLYGIWESHPVWFIFAGRDNEILQVRASWNRAVPPTERDRILALLNQAHEDHVWPKAYLPETEDGTVVVVGDVTADFEFGATDEMIDLHLRTGIATSLQLFEQLDEHYPAAAEEAKAQFN